MYYVDIFQIYCVDIRGNRQNFKNEMVRCDAVTIEIAPPVASTAHVTTCNSSTNICGDCFMEIDMDSILQSLVKKKVRISSMGISNEESWSCFLNAR